MKRILHLHSLITASIVILTLAILIAGRALNPAPESLLTADDCRLPCWDGLRPGKTTISEANLILHAQGYRTATFDPDPILTNTSFIATESNLICEVHLEPAPGGIFSQMTLRPCSPLHVGDILSLIGQPESMLPIASVIIFQEGQTILLLQSPICTGATVSPHANIRYILLSEEGVNINTINQPTNVPWQGFVPFWRYHQLHPDRPICPRR